MTTSLLVMTAVLLAVPTVSPARVRLLGPRIAEPVSAASAAPMRRPVGDRRLVVLIAAVLTVAGVVIAGAPLPAAIATGLVAAVTAATVNAGIAQRRRVRRRRLIAGAIEMLHSELTAGSREAAALAAAAEAAGADGAPLVEAARLAGLGLDVAAALSTTAAFAPLGAAWRVQAACGALLADVVGQVGRDRRAAETSRQAADSALAGPVSSSAMLAALPGLGIALGAAMGAHPLRWLFSAGVGCLVLLLGVALDVGGWCWIALLVRRARQ